MVILGVTILALYFRTISLTIPWSMVGRAQVESHPEQEMMRASTGNGSEDSGGMKLGIILETELVEVWLSIQGGVCKIPTLGKNEYNFSCQGSVSDAPSIYFPWK